MTFSYHIRVIGDQHYSILVHDTLEIAKQRAREIWKMCDNPHTLLIEDLHIREIVFNYLEK